MRQLSPDEAGLWARVMATVKPMRAAVRTAKAPVSAEATRFARKVPTPPAAPVPPAVRASSRSGPGTTLDGGWDKRLARGLVMPERSIDLHGHTLASAHALLDQGLAQAIARGDRVVLLVTGKPPRPESERPHARGAIRAAVADWLGSSRHADHIAAIRGAHPRHGGAGALYIVLRRGR